MSSPIPETDWTQATTWLHHHLDAVSSTGQSFKEGAREDTRLTPDFTLGQFVDWVCGRIENARVSIASQADAAWVNGQLRQIVSEAAPVWDDKDVDRLLRGNTTELTYEAWRRAVVGVLTAAHHLATAFEEEASAGDFVDQARGDVVVRPSTAFPDYQRRPRL